MVTAAQRIPAICDLPEQATFIVGLVLYQQQIAPGYGLSMQNTMGWETLG